VRLKDDGKIEAIFEATIALTSTKGLNGLTMSAIAKKAKIASGTLYIYFEGKEQLLNELYRYLMLKGTLSLLPSIAHLPLKQQLFTIWSNVLKFRISNSSQAAFLHQFRYSSFLSEESRKVDEQFVGHLVAFLNAGKKEFIVKDMDNNILIPLMYGYVNNLARHLALKKIKMTEKIVEQTFVICWDAIKA